MFSNESYLIDILTPLRNTIDPPPDTKYCKIHCAKVSSGSQLKGPISRKWPAIALCILLATHHKMGIQLTDKRRFAKYFQNSNSSLTEKSSTHEWHCILSFLVSFYRVILKNDYLGPMAIWTFTGTHSILNIQ